MAQQTQFLDVIDRDEAQRRFHAALRLDPLPAQTVRLAEALGRVLAADVLAPVDVPSFDRSNFDGFAVCAKDTFGADEERPATLRLLDEVLATGVRPGIEVTVGTAASIATGAMLPRGADAVAMVEHTDLVQGRVLVRKVVAPGHGVSFAGSDIAAGELVLRRGETLTSRETGVLAAIGLAQVQAVRRPVVAVISTGDEILPPGQPMQPPLVYDSNQRILADAVRESGGVPLELGIVGDDEPALRKKLTEALAAADVVLFSGGTSKGTGDLCYRVVQELSDPGIVAHGVALKPGKPICLAVTAGRPVVILPGFPTSAIFTFHEFVAPVIRCLAGRRQESRQTVPARLAVRLNSQIGRTEYSLVSLVEAAEQSPGTARLAAYPMGQGSGSVTTFSRADGFITVGRHEELLEAGSDVNVTLLGRDLQPADLVTVGSHCVGLDLLLADLSAQGLRTKSLVVGSTAGLAAARRGECDIAGTHLYDPQTGEYNRPFLTRELELVPGYGRMQGIVFRPGDERFEGRTANEAVTAALADADCRLINRNAGSGTRILIDELLSGARPAGYAYQASSHTAVAAAVTQERADWGLAIETVARQAGLGFIPVRQEQYDFTIPKSRRARPAVKAFFELLESGEMREKLRAAGFAVG